MYIAEQQLIAAAVGLRARGWNAFGSTFAAFLRARYDFVRMAAISRVNLRLSQARTPVFSIGEDGPSQMAPERHRLTPGDSLELVLHPCDANQTARSSSPRWRTRKASCSFARCGPEHAGHLRLRTKSSEVGGSKVIRSSENDNVTIVGIGVTVHEALGSRSNARRGGNQRTRVIDAYSVASRSTRTPLQAASEATGRIITVEGPFPRGRARRMQCWPRSQRRTSTARC